MNIQPIIDQLKPAETYWLGYSGGLDSHVLLHLLSYTQLNIQAVYINHGLSVNANAWASHCEQVCRELAISFTTICVQAEAEIGQSPEAAAREARYQAFSQLLQPGDYLLTAHHQDDQAETLLLQLLRGAGSKGLASMPLLKPFAQGHQLRPLLEYSRAELLAYAKAHHLNWIEDESNSDTRFDRNFIRQQIMPALAQRWPAASRTIARAAKHLAEEGKTLAWFVARELAELVGSQAQTLSVSKLLTHTTIRQKLLVRAWLQQLALPTPSEAQLEQMLSSVVNSKQDAQPQVEWEAYQLRRYRDKLYVLPNRPSLAEPNIIPWDLKSPLILPRQVGSLTAELVLGQGLSQQQAQQGQVTIRFRQGGERCKPQGRIGTHPLKKLFQEWDIPPWLRDKVPLLYINEELAAVIGFCICEPFAAKVNEAGYKVKQL